MALKRTDFVNDQYLVAGNMDWLRKFADIRKISQNIGETYEYNGEKYTFVNVTPYGSEVTDSSGKTILLNANEAINIVENGTFLNNKNEVNPQDNTQEYVQDVINSLTELYNNFNIEGLPGEWMTWVGQFQDAIISSIKKQTSTTASLNNLKLEKIAMNWMGVEIPDQFAEYRNQVYKILQDYGKKIRHPLGNSYAYTVLSSAFNTVKEYLPVEQTNSETSTPEETTPEETTPEETTPEETAPEGTTAISGVENLKQEINKIYQDISAIESGQEYQKLIRYEKDLPVVKDTLSKYNTFKKHIEFAKNLVDSLRLPDVSAQNRFFENLRNKSWMPTMFTTPEEKQRRQRDLSPEMAEEGKQALISFAELLGQRIQPAVSSLFNIVRSAYGDPSFKDQNTVKRIWQAVSSAQDTLSGMNLPAQSPEEQAAKQQLENDIQAVDESRNVYDSDGEASSKIDTDGDGIPDTPANVDTDNDGTPDAVDDDGDNIADRPADKAGKPGTPKSKGKSNSKGSGTASPGGGGASTVVPVAPGGAIAGRDEPDPNSDFATIQKNIHNALLEIKQYVEKYSLSKKVKLNDIISALDTAIGSVRSMEEIKETKGEQAKAEAPVAPKEPEPASDTPAETAAQVEEVKPKITSNEETPPPAPAPAAPATKPEPVAQPSPGDPKPAPAASAAPASAAPASKAVPAAPAPPPAPSAPKPTPPPAPSAPKPAPAAPAPAAPAPAAPAPPAPSAPKTVPPSSPSVPKPAPAEQPIVEPKPKVGPETVEPVSDSPKAPPAEKKRPSKGPGRSNKKNEEMKLAPISKSSKWIKI